MDEHTSFALAAFAVYGGSAAIAIAAMFYGYEGVAVMAVLGAFVVQIQTGTGEGDEQ